MSDTETLINTLLANGLASSRSEAQRMAESMISTSNKVNESMRQDRDNSMVKDYGEARRAKQSAQEQKIEELRQKALNPEPVQVQTEFDTPLNDLKNDQKRSEVAPEQAPLQTEAPIAQEAQAVEAQPQQEQQLTPEFYAAQQMQNMGAQTVSDLTAEPQPEQATPQTNFAQEEVQLESVAPIQSEAPVVQESPSLEAEPPRDFISQEPAQEVPAEPLMPATQAPKQHVEQGINAIPPSQPTPEQVGSPLEASPTPQEAQPVQEEAPVEKKKNLMSEEDKKLAEEVDLSRVFNFSNR